MRSNPITWGMLGVATALVGTPLVAHHSWDAEFDDKKPVTLKGVVTKYEWNNPHVFVNVDVTDKTGVSTWVVELASISDLKSAGWTRETLNVGDVITVEGSLA